LSLRRWGCARVRRIYVLRLRKDPKRSFTREAGKGERAAHGEELIAECACELGNIIEDVRGLEVLETGVLTFAGEF
jgi:hypothetical protein